jgi:O-antigen ligase
MTTEKFFRLPKPERLFAVLAGSFILLNMADKEIFSFGPLMVHEWIIFALFVLVVVMEIANAGISYTWVDNAFLIFFVCALAVPSVANFGSWRNLPFGEIMGFYLPVKTWMVYRIALHLAKTDFSGRLKTILFFGAIAAVIGYIRFLPLGGLSRAVNELWPIKGIGVDPHRWSRVVSTMSDANGSGAFFAVCIFMAFYLYLESGKDRYLVLSGFFVFTMFLTGSFSSGLAFAGIFLVVFKKHLRFGLTARWVSIAVFLAAALFLVGPIREFTAVMIEKRNAAQFGRATGNVPRQFEGRIMRWPAQLIPFYDQPLFGTGPRLEEETEHRVLARAGTTNPHNYYIYLLIHGGIVGLLGYIAFKIILIVRLGRLKIYTKEAEVLTAVIYLGLITQVSQLTFQYGGYSELFGITMALAYHLGKREKAGRTAESPPGSAG